MSKIGVYILRCCNNRYYIGSTNNIERRLQEHGNGRVGATKNILPIEIKFFHPCETLQEARKIEYKLKSKKSRSIIESVIKDGFIKFI